MFWRMWFYFEYSIPVHLNFHYIIRLRMGVSQPCISRNHRLQIRNHNLGRSKLYSKFVLQHRLLMFRCYYWSLLQIHILTMEEYPMKNLYFHLFEMICLESNYGLSHSKCCILKLQDFHYKHNWFWFPENVCFHLHYKPIQIGLFLLRIPTDLRLQHIPRFY